MFLRAVKLYNSGDFRSSAEDMERALAEYLAVFARCLAGCEGAQEQVEFKDFYPAIAGTGLWWPETPRCEAAAESWSGQEAGLRGAGVQGLPEGARRVPGRPPRSEKSH